MRKTLKIHHRKPAGPTGRPRKIFTMKKSMMGGARVTADQLGIPSGAVTQNPFSQNAFRTSGPSGPLAPSAMSTMTEPPSAISALTAPFSSAISGLTTTSSVGGPAPAPMVMGPAASQSNSNSQLTAGDAVYVVRYRKQGGVVQEKEVLVQDPATQTYRRYLIGDTNTPQKCVLSVTYGEIGQHLNTPFASAPECGISLAPMGAV
jgi:hypothetical protein